MSQAKNNPFEQIISCINTVLGANKSSDFKALDKHIIIPALVPLPCLLILWVTSLISKDFAELLVIPIKVVLLGCLLYLFGVVIHAFVQLIKVFPTRAPIFNRAEHDYPILESMLRELVKISYKERKKFVQWLENRVKQEYKVAGVFSILFAGAPKILKSIGDLLDLKNPKYLEQLETFSAFLLILGIFAILLTLLLNSFQKYIFYTQYSIDHGNNRKTQDL